MIYNQLLSYVFNSQLITIFILTLFIIFILFYFIKKYSFSENFQHSFPSKCFSCDRQLANKKGKNNACLGSATKCFSCQEQYKIKKKPIYLSNKTKCFSCENNNSDDINQDSLTDKQKLEKNLDKQTKFLNFGRNTHINRK